MNTPTVPKPFTDLERGDVIAVHPDHPGQEVAYAVEDKPTRVPDFGDHQEQAMVDYTTANGESGRLILRADTVVRIRGVSKQYLALTVAADLSTRDLPAITTWQISRGGRIEAQLAGGLRGDAQSLAHLYEWSVALNQGEPVDIKTHTYDANPESTQVWIEGTVNGVLVQVWDAIATPDPRDEAEGEVQS